MMLRKRLTIFLLLALTVIIIPSPLTSIPLAKAFSRTASLSLNSTLPLPPVEGSVVASVMDAVGGYAYFRTGGHAVIEKVRLSNFTPVGSLNLNVSEGWPEAPAVIDAAAGYAYFGTNVGSSPNSGFIFKVRLSNFTVAGNLNIPSTAAVIDPAAGYAYFASGNAIVKIRLSNFTEVASLTLSQGIVHDSAVINPTGGYAYFMEDYRYPGTPNVVARIRLSNFTLAGTLTLNSYIDSYQTASAVIDPAAGYAYFGHSSIVKIRLSDFSVVGNLSLPSTAAVIDPAAGYAYFAGSGGGYGGLVTQVRLSDFTSVGNLTWNSNNGNPISAVIDSAAGYAYFGNAAYPGVVMKILLSNLTIAGILIMKGGAGPLLSAVIDSGRGFAYFGSYEAPAIIFKVRLSDFTLVGSLALPGLGGLSTAVIDQTADFAYFGTFRPPYSIVKVRLSNFTLAGTLTLNQTDGCPTSAVIDSAGGYAYFGTSTNYVCPSGTTPVGVVVRVRLSDFTFAGALALNTGEYDLDTAVIDPVGGYTYFSTDTAPGIVVRVRLSNFTRAGSLIFNNGENALKSAVIDPAAGFAYFGTSTFYTQGNVIVKVRLFNFTRAGSLTLPPFGNGYDINLQSAVIDSVDGYAYFASNSSVSIIERIRLSNFTLSGGLTLDPHDFGLLSAVIDVDHGFAYWGGYGFLVKVQVWSSLNIPCSGQTCNVVSNSTLTNGTYVPNNLYFNETGSPGGNAFANATVPHSLVPDISKAEVYQNGMLVSSAEITTSSNTTHYSLHVNFLQHAKDGFRICMGPCSTVGIPPLVPAMAILLAATLMLSSRRHLQWSPRLSSRAGISSVLDTE